MDKKDFIKGYDTVEGRNPVAEILKAKRSAKKLLAAKGLDRSGEEIIKQAQSMGIKIEYVDRSQLDKLSRTKSHQGIIALVEKFRYAEGLDVVIDMARETKEDPLVVVLDRISDPHNLGAIIRTAYCCGAHGIIIPRRNAVGVTPVVVKSSSGATEYLPVVQVTNTVRILEEMKDKGFWIAGADMDGEVMYKADLKGPLALVLGSEGRGIGRLVKEKCDFVVSIPMKGSISSLNVSVAAGVLLYEAIRQREFR